MKQWSSWTLRDEAQWLGLLPGWDHGAPLPAELRPGYVRGLKARAVDFTGTKPFPDADRRALLAALDGDATLLRARLE